MNEPAIKENHFICPNCHVHTHHGWEEVLFRDDRSLLLKEKSASEGSMNKANTPVEKYAIYMSRCIACGKKTIWIDGEMVYPESSAPEPMDGMPDNVLQTYKEAGSIYKKSPRSACAVLRLAIEQLLQYIKEEGKTIDNKIGLLVEEGIQMATQKALDIIRVVGNKSIHDIEIAIDYTEEETVLFLFNLINMVVADIAQKDEINSMYKHLPKSALDAIEKRDKKPTQ